MRFALLFSLLILACEGHNPNGQAQIGDPSPASDCLEGGDPGNLEMDPEPEPPETDAEAIEEDAGFEPDPPTRVPETVTLYPGERGDEIRVGAFGALSLSAVRIIDQGGVPAVNRLVIFKFDRGSVNCIPARESGRCAAALVNDRVLTDATGSAFLVIMGREPPDPTVPCVGHVLATTEAGGEARVRVCVDQPLPQDP